MTHAKARSMRPEVILGSTVNMVDLAFIEQWIEKCIQDGPHCRQLIVTGFHGLNRAHRDPNYFKIGAECDLWVPDSIAPVLIAEKRGMKDAVRTPGAEIFTGFLEMAHKKGFSSFFYGDTDQTLNALRERLETDYPGHKIAGMISPPYRPLTAEEEQQYIDQINEANPDVLWVGLGLPKQDEWIYRCKDRLQVPVAAGIGAAFGFLAGTTDRAPMWLQKLNLEWAYMLMKKPGRTGRRVFVEGRQFIFSVLKEECARRSS